MVCVSPGTRLVTVTLLTFLRLSKQTYYSSLNEMNN